MIALPSGMAVARPSGVGPPPGGHRYWRLLITANDGGPFFGLSDLELRTSLGGPTVTDVAWVNSAASASSFINSDNNPTKAFDEDPTNTGWLSASAVTSWIKWDFDFQSPSGPYPDIIQYGIYGSWNSANSSPQDFELQWSDDDSAWTTVSTETGETGWSASELRVFTV